MSAVPAPEGVDPRNEWIRYVASVNTSTQAAAADRSYTICGGHPLQGTVAVGGAKNAISKQLVASLLTTEPCVFRNVPRIAEIDAVISMLSEVGAECVWLAADTLQVQTRTIRTPVVGSRYSGFNRIPILMLAPLLHRTGSAAVPVVGGCPIGPRPVDFHIHALESLGAAIDEYDGGYRAQAGRLHGTTISLAYPSVGATETSLLASVLARGTTVIHNAAIEPEVVDTVLFLQKMGAQISIDVDRRIVVEGVERLGGAQHIPVTDRIEVASFAAAAVATNGEITVRHARQSQMTSFLNQLRKVGGGFVVENDGMRFFRRQSDLSPAHLETDVHPGFMTDWQQPFAVLLTQAEGMSVIHETVYENRFGYTDALRQMGADIELASFCLGRKACRFLNNGHAHSCVIRGRSRLEGCAVRIPDLRAGFAYVIAALTARGESRLTGLEYLERGYADIPEKLLAVGGAITVTSPSQPSKAA